MAQHDYSIANQSGQAFRADLNNALAAIVSSNSGVSAPSTTYAYQWWVDTGTSPATLKQRNSSNNAWITIGNLDTANLGMILANSGSIVNADISASAGIVASKLSFTQTGDGTAARTIDSKLKEQASIKDFGGVGDGVTSDQTAVVNAIASGFESIRVNDNAKFLVGSLSNPLGVEFEGSGHIVQAITGGLRKLNSYGDLNKYVCGQEFMAAFHNLLIAQHTTPTRKPIMVFSGDSTTYGIGGNGVTTEYTISELLKAAGEEKGLQSPYGLSSINRGQPGANTEQWRTTYLAGDLAANPDLLVLRWGINDPGWLKNGTTPPLDSGQSYPNRRDVNDFITSLRSGLTTIRASRSIASLSIVLMTPNSTYDTPNARDALWYEQITPGIKQAARDFGCVFIDTYAYLRDSSQAANVWMDDPFGDGRGIHPLNVMNMWIAGLMSSVIFPEGFENKLGRANVRNIGGAEDVGDVTRAPSYYKYGVTIGRAAVAGAGGTAWLFDGGVVTIRSQDEIVIQINYPYKTADTPRRYAYRMGRAISLGAGAAAGWESWQYFGEAAFGVTAASGYTVPGTGGMRTVINGSVVTAEGYITMNTPAVLGANTTVATIAAGYRPVQDAFYGIATVWNGSLFETVRCRVNSTGELVIYNGTTLAANRIWLNASWTTFA